MDNLLLIGAVLVGGVWLLRHLALYNRRNCPRCHGSGKQRSGVFGERWRTCGRCGGNGNVRGWGGRSEG